MKVLNHRFEPQCSVDSIRPHERNARQADCGLIYESIETNGFYGAIVAQKSTGKILAGNHRYLAAKSLGAQTVPVMWVDVSDTEALRILLVDNRANDQASYDMNALAELVESVRSNTGLSGTGWDEDALENLLGDLAGLTLGEMSGSAKPKAHVGSDDIVPREVIEGPNAVVKTPVEPEEQPAPGPVTTVLKSGKCDDDEAPEVQEQPISAVGDIWLLGGHRIICGSCLNAADVSRLFDGKRASLAFTSPPYASQRKYDESSEFRPIHPDSYVEWFSAVAHAIQNVLADDGSYFLNIKEHAEGGQRHLYVKDLTIAHVRQWGWRFVDEFCWRDKKNGVPGGWPNRFKDAWEPVFHFSKHTKIKFYPLANGTQTDHAFEYSPENAKAGTGSGLLGSEKASSEKTGIARPSNVIEIAAASSGSHPAAFPVELPAWFIRAFSDESDIVFDPFMGSGTTLIAAEKHSRIALGTEISPKYVDVIVKRWQTFTGQQATLDGDGRTFDEIAAERQALPQAA